MTKLAKEELGDPCRVDMIYSFPMDPHTLSESNWTLQAYIHSLQSHSEKVCGSIGFDCQEFGVTWCNFVVQGNYNNGSGSSLDCRHCGPRAQDMVLSIPNTPCMAYLHTLGWLKSGSMYTIHTSPMECLAIAIGPI